MHIKKLWEKMISKKFRVVAKVSVSADDLRLTATQEEFPDGAGDTGDPE